MKFPKYRLQNEMNDQVLDMGSESSGSNDYATDNEMLETSSEDMVKELGLDPSKYGIGEVEAKDEPAAEESQGSDETQEAGQQDADESAYLEWVNSLGATHSGNPLKIESVDEVKNALQMFKDYTVKTQSLSEERKAWDSQKVESEKEMNATLEAVNESVKAHEQQLKDLQQWTFTLNELQKHAPEIFEEVQSRFQETSKQFSNPILDQQLQAVNKRLSEAEAKLAERENKAIVGEFEREKSGLVATEQSFKELGVNIDWDEVKTKWAETGLPVQSVVGSLYIDKIAKAQASKQKVEQTKTKIASKPARAAAAARPGTKTPAVNRGTDYLSQAMELLKSM